MSPAAITALGAVSSVGLDAATTCASIRAGIVRPAPLAGAKVLDLEDYREVPVIGHPVSSLADGFSNVGRWQQLAAPALADLCASTALPAASANHGFWQQTECIAVLPSLDERFFPDPNCADDVIYQTFIQPLLERSRQFFAPARTSVCARGRVGLFESLGVASEAIKSRRASRVVIVAVDSLVDSASLSWLLEADRIKCDDNPVGLSPGEAACAILVEDVVAARQRGARTIAQVRSVSTAAEAKALLKGELSQGEALTNVIEQVLLQRGGDGSIYRGGLIADLNGEQWRANEFGAAQAGVSPSLWDCRHLVFPAQSTGDVGAALSSIQIAFACHELARGTAPIDGLLVTSSDEHGLVGAAVLSAASGGA